ncbi:MAG: hypothetical protein ACK5QW_08700 [Cyanobacteriota bacterium]|jgi:hypothetical protein
MTNSHGHHSDDDFRFVRQESLGAGLLLTAEAISAHSPRPIDAAVEALIADAS